MAREKGMMDLELAKRLIKEVKNTKFCNEIVTNVMGEPLLYKGLFTLLEYANMLGQKICILTNGETLDEGMSFKLFQFPPAAINISYHVHNDASFSYRQSSLTYEQYKNRILNLIDLKFQLKAKTHIHVNVLSTINKPHDKFKILGNLKDIDLFKNEWITFAKFIRKKHKIFWQIPDTVYPGANELLPGFAVSFYLAYHSWSGSILPSGTKVIPCLNFFCPTPFNQFNVLWNGDLTLCCIDYNGDLVYDNIKNKSIMEAFNSDNIKRIRRNFIEAKNIHKKCLCCYGKIVNSGGSECMNPKILYKLSLLDNLKRDYFILYRLLWQKAFLGFFYRRLILRSKMGEWFQKKYWANLSNS
jgi:MoaA/NifB/PqqE/SkfB family radical SAM enzyme